MMMIVVRPGTDRMLYLFAMGEHQGSTGCTISNLGPTSGDFKKGKTIILDGGRPFATLTARTRRSNKPDVSMRHQPSPKGSWAARGARCSST
jgi:hypothetical protein